MTAAPSHSEKGKHNSQTTRRRLSTKTITITIVAVVCALLIWLLCFNGVSQYSGDKSRSQTDIQALLDQIQSPSGKQLYSAVADQGCDDGNSVGLELVVHCELAGYKYYESPSYSSADLQPFDKILTVNGWTSDDTSKTDDSSYYRTGANSYAAIESNASQVFNPDIQNLIDTKKISPDPNQTVYGVTITVMYWSCMGAAFQLPCHLPPSRLN